MASRKTDFANHVKEQLQAALGKSSVVVKAVSVLLVVGYCLSFSETAMKYLTVTPGYVLPPNFWVWTYITNSLIETHWWEVVIDIMIVVLYGKLVEPLWGALEMLIFYFVVNISVAVVASFFYVFIYFVTKNEDYLFHTHIHGFAGYLAGFSVAVKQVMSDNILINNPIGKLRNKDIPVCLLVIAILLRLVGTLDGVYPVMFGLGILTSWVYLRFYQRHSNGHIGDMEDGFSFASFFPTAFKPVVAVPANTIFEFLVKAKVCRKPQRRYDVSSPTTITVSLPGMDPQDAERRRLRAIKALNERLSKAEQQPDWPSIAGPTSPTSPQPADSSKPAPAQPPPPPAQPQQPPEASPPLEKPAEPETAAETGEGQKTGQ